MVDRYVAMEKFSKVATAADATANEVVFSMDYEPVGLIPRVLAVTTGAPNETGLTCLVAENATTEKYDITVVVTDLAEGDIVSLIAYA